MALTEGTICPNVSAMNSFRSIIELWPTRDELAGEIGATPSQVSKWWQRDSIPSEWWAALLSTSKAQVANVSADTLTALAARDLQPFPRFVEARA